MIVCMDQRAALDDPAVAVARVPQVQAVEFVAQVAPGIAGDADEQQTGPPNRCEHPALLALNTDRAEAMV